MLLVLVAGFIFGLSSMYIGIAAYQSNADYFVSQEDLELVYNLGYTDAVCEFSGNITIPEGFNIPDLTELCEEHKENLKEVLSNEEFYFLDFLFFENYVQESILVK